MQAARTRSCCGGLLSASHQSYSETTASKFNSKVFVAPRVGGVTALDGSGPSRGLFGPHETIELGGELPEEPFGKLSSGPFWKASLKPSRSSFRPGLCFSENSHIGKGIPFNGSFRKEVYA